MWAPKAEKETYQHAQFSWINIKTSLFNLFISQSVFKVKQTARCSRIIKSTLKTHQNTNKLSPHHLCLFDRSGESIQQESVPAGRRLKVLLYELHNHLIADLQGHKNSSLSSNNILALYIYFMSIQNLFIQQQEMDIKVHKYEQTAPNCESQTDGRKSHQEPRLHAGRWNGNKELCSSCTNMCTALDTNIEENTQTPRNVTEVSFDIKET